MAATGKSPSYEDLAASFNEGRFEPLYFLYGEEGLLMDELQDLLIGNALQPHERDFNLDIFSGPDANVRNVLATCASYPMMAQRRVVVVRQFESLAENREFVGYAAQPNPAATVLLLCGSKPNLSTHPYRALREQAVSVEFKSLSDRQLPGWLTQRARSMGVRLEGSAAQMLAQDVGSDLRSASGELEKLRVYVGDRTTITDADVIEAGGHSRDFNVFELQRAIGAADRARATAIVERLLEQASSRQSEAIRIVALLSWYFQKLRLLAAIQTRQSSEQDIARQIGVRPFQVKDFVSGLRNLGRPAVTRGLRALLAADFELKGGSSRDPRLILLLALRAVMVPIEQGGTLVEHVSRPGRIAAR